MLGLGRPRQHPRLNRKIERNVPSAVPARISGVIKTGTADCNDLPFLTGDKRGPRAMGLQRQVTPRQCSSRFGKNLRGRGGRKRSGPPPVGDAKQRWLRMYRRQSLQRDSRQTCSRQGRRFFCFLSFRRVKKKGRRGAGRSARGLALGLSGDRIIPPPAQEQAPRKHLPPPPSAAGR